MNLLAQTTQQAVETAVSASTDRWYDALIAAIVVAGVALITALSGLAMAWVNAWKAKAAVAEAKAKAEAAQAATQTNSERITTTSRAVDNMRSDLTRVAHAAPPPKGDL
jgi:hypothetical protein